MVTIKIFSRRSFLLSYKMEILLKLTKIKIKYFFSDLFIDAHRGGGGRGKGGRGRRGARMSPQ